MLKILIVTEIAVCLYFLIPSIYHFVLFRSQLRNGEYISSYEPNHSKLAIVKFLGFIIALLIGLLIYAMANDLSNYASENETEDVAITENIDIIALSDNATSTGRFTGIFYIQSGKIDEKMVYRMMLKDGNRARYFTLPMDTTDLILFKDNEDIPHIEVTWWLRKRVKSGEYVETFVTDDTLNGFSRYSGMGSIENIVIHVPEGSVLSNFEVDLK